MGKRKRESAAVLKEANKKMAFAKLNNCPTSPRKMRLVADQVRGEDVNKALAILKFSPKEASRKLEKLLIYAISNWQAKNEDAHIEK
jgi:large subunit ribosomal protein L22